MQRKKCEKADKIRGKGENEGGKKRRGCRLVKNRRNVEKIRGKLVII